MKETEIRISGMSCNHCVMSVRKELSKIPGVDVKDVQIGSARVAYDENTVSPKQIAEAIAEAGYTVAG